jgi:hypothetical protein
MGQAGGRVLQRRPQRGFGQGRAVRPDEHHSAAAAAVATAGCGGGSIAWTGAGAGRQWGAKASQCVGEEISQVRTLPEERRW